VRSGFLQSEAQTDGQNTKLEGNFALQL